MNKAKLRVIDNNREHPRDIAAKLIQKRTVFKPYPKINQHHSGQPTMDVDEVLDRTAALQRSHLGKK